MKNQEKKDSSESFEFRPVHQKVEDWLRPLLIADTFCISGHEEEKKSTEFFEIDQSN